MLQLPLHYGIWLAAALFLTGLAGVMIRRNVVFILMSIEIMLNAAGLAFVVAGARWGQADGQVMFLLILTLAAAEVAVGLAMILQIYRRYRGVDANEISEMRG